MSDAIEALSEYKYLLESMGHGAQSTGPYMRCLEAIAALQAMQGEADTKTYTNLCQKGSAPHPAVPEGYVPVPIELTETMLRAWFSAARDPAEGVGILDYFRAAYQALLSAAKGEAPQPAVPDVDVNQQLVEALKDMLSGWRYIREVHGDLYGVGWDRAQKAAEKALLSAAKG
jgi:hypothetical protein